MSHGPTDEIAERVQRNLGHALRAARWLLAPLYVGLLLSLLLLLFKFAQVLIAAVPALPRMSSSETIVKVLTLTDLALVANLVVIVILAGWRNVTRPGSGWAGSSEKAWSLIHVISFFSSSDGTRGSVAGGMMPVRTFFITRSQRAWSWTSASVLNSSKCTPPFLEPSP